MQSIPSNRNGFADHTDIGCACFDRYQAETLQHRNADAQEASSGRLPEAAVFFRSAKAVTIA
ncbi:hypothetical protein EFQ99_21690 [Rhizobium vallis]|uniref:Uncharacterized protein n=2 Tax=Rhizobium vallis TaxID=634290 RepID=A0A3S0QN23_9HYPH|nr:hypothetical protein EFQ99_21690 [Rhizobium vallis]